MGKRAEEHRGALRLANPMEHGVVTNWEDMERLWQFVYAEENLNLPTEGQPVRGDKSEAIVTLSDSSCCSRCREDGCLRTISIVFIRLSTCLKDMVYWRACACRRC